jgi:hypothetical protein
MGLLQMLLIEESRAVAVVSGDASRRDAMSALFFSLRRVRDVEVLSPASVPLRPVSFDHVRLWRKWREEIISMINRNQYIIYIQIPSQRRS